MFAVCGFPVPHTILPIYLLDVWPNPPIPSVKLPMTLASRPTPRATTGSVPARGPRSLVGHVVHTVGALILATIRVPYSEQSSSKTCLKDTSSGDIGSPMPTSSPPYANPHSKTHEGPLGSIGVCFAFFVEP